jgi:hypothetical protein
MIFRLFSVTFVYSIHIDTRQAADFSNVDWNLKVLYCSTANLVKSSPVLSLWKVVIMNTATQEVVNKEWNAMAGEWDDLASVYHEALMKVLWEQTKIQPKQE